MKSLSILKDEKKLDLNNSGTILLARLLPLSEIKLQKEFQDLFPLNPANVEKLTQRITETGYDNSQPVHIWHKDNTYVLIDGHHRREGAIRAGLHEIPCSLHSFSTKDEALKYAISLQTDRRNLSDAELLTALKVVDALKIRGMGAEGDKGKSASRSAQILGISTSRVEKTRMIEKYASKEIKDQIKSGELTLNKAYLLVRENLEPETAQVKIKKPSKELIQFIQRANKFFEENDMTALQSLFQEYLSLKGK
jgi:ParB family chromosome partitioning protein